MGCLGGVGFDADPVLVPTSDLRGRGAMALLRRAFVPQERLMQLGWTAGAVLEQIPHQVLRLRVALTAGWILERPFLARDGLPKSERVRRILEVPDAAAIITIARARPDGTTRKCHDPASRNADRSRRDLAIDDDVLIARLRRKETRVLDRRTRHDARSRHAEDEQLESRTPDRHMARIRGPTRNSSDRRAEQSLLRHSTLAPPWRVLLHPTVDKKGSRGTPEA